tara:strand:- start:195 stop:1085 length:891 start_codon:yes stop_codon:yes gene_type:complete
MNTKINKILSNQNISENTKITYSRNFMKINMLINNNKKSFVPFKDIENIKKVVNDNIKSDGSKKLAYISIAMVLKNQRGYKKISSTYTDLSFKLTNIINEGLKDNVMSDTQKDKVKSYSSLVNIVEELRLKKDNSKTEYNDYMLAYLYVIPTFTPRNEYMKINVVYNPTDVNTTDNYILVEDKKITCILQDYKTKKKYGKIEYVYSTKEHKVLRKYITFLENPSIIFDFNRQFLHKKLNQLLDTSNRFIRITKNDYLIKKSSYVKKSFKEKEQFQIKNFQHSIYQAETSYRKNELN